MNFFGSLLLFLGGMITLGIARAVSSILSRGRGGVVTSVIVPVLVVILIGAGASMYLDNNGDVVPGTVTAKNEQINTYDTGTYTRVLNVDVEFQPRDDSLRTTVRLGVDGALFDQLHNGETVQVRYINPAGLFLFSRLKQQTTLSLIPWEMLWPIFLIASFILLVYLWFKKPRTQQQEVIEPPSEPGSEPVAPRSPRRPIVFALFVVWLGATLFTIFRPALIAPSSDTWKTTTARVRNIRRYTEVAESRRTSRTIPLIQPYDLAQLTFTPQGLSESVIAVDAIDAMTIQPEQGSELTIKYPADNPRAAVVADATHTNYWKNPLGGIGFTFGSIVAFSLILFLLRMTWKILTRGLVAIVARR
jgi:hypothetical protein